MDQPPMDAMGERMKRRHRGEPGRKFGLLDAMILVAAVAVGATSIRPFLLYGLVTPEFFREFYSDSGLFVYTAYSDSVVRFLGPWLASWTLAFLAIRLRKPRPRFRRLMRQPGTAACVAAAFVMAVEGAMAMAVIGAVGAPDLENFYIKMLPYLFESAAVAVAAVWSVAALAGRWKPEPGWVDRTGRVIGAAWIMTCILFSFFAYMDSAIQSRYAPPGPSPAQIAIEEQLFEDRKQLLENQIKSEVQRGRDLARELEALKREVGKPK